MGSEILYQFLFESSGRIFEKPKKIGLGETCWLNFLVNVFVHFDLLESISDKSSTIGLDQNFMLFLNMGLKNVLFIFVQE